MATKHMLVTTMLLAALTIGGCLSSQAGNLLPAPSGTDPEAARHNQEGVEAYNNSQWTAARKHFEAAVKASPSLAEAHYNLGMVLYRTGAEGEARPHFVKAANLAPGNEVEINVRGRLFGRPWPQPLMWLCDRAEKGNVRALGRAREGS